MIKNIILYILLISLSFNQEIITFDSSKPDGTPRKLLDTSALSNLGWQAKTDIDQGLRKSYDWFLENCT